MKQKNMIYESFKYSVDCQSHLGLYIPFYHLKEYILTQTISKYIFHKKSMTVHTVLYISSINEKLNYVMHFFSNVYVKRISIFTLCKLNFENAYDLELTINNSKKHV